VHIRHLENLNFHIEGSKEDKRNEGKTPLRKSMSQSRHRSQAILPTNYSTPIKQP
jgi:hypothetical protein